MLKLRKIFLCFALTILLLTSSVFANEAMPISAQPPLEVSDEKTTVNAPETLSKDLYIYNTDSYTFSDIVEGNVFASTTKFVTNPRNKGGIISGDLFIVSNEVVIGSDVSYSNNKDRNGNYIVSSINSKSVINGNVYVCSDSFTLEAGSEINGDLYIASTNVNIEQDAVIDGNVFITGSNINLNGQIAGSAYITAANFDMNYFAYISRDLYLNSDNATLAGVIYRNAYITVQDKLETSSYFRVDQNLSVDYANNFVYAGQVKKNVVINAKSLSFNNAENEKCIINGDLKYATKNETSIPDGIVSGKVSTAEFEEMITGFSVQEAMYNFFVLLVYVFVVALLSKLFAPKAIEKLSTLTIKNVIISFAIGFASLFAILLLFIFLIVLGAGIALALLAVVGYLFVLGLALPLLINTIADMIKLKLHLYVKLLIVTAVFYILSLLPVIGSPIVFVALLVGTGRILLGLFSRKN